MQYVVFAEKNHKEHETFIFYLQYTGNEKKIDKFAKLVERANFDFMDGDYSEFLIQTSVKISEQSVIEHLRINLGSYARMFSVCKGHFDFNFDSLEDLSDTDLACALDNNFFACRIKDFFKS
jgi:hypothetical protein